MDCLLHKEERLLRGAEQGNIRFSLQKICGRMPLSERSGYALRREAAVYQRECFGTIYEESFEGSRISVSYSREEKYSSVCSVPVASEEKAVQDDISEAELIGYGIY